MAAHCRCSSQIGAIFLLIITLIFSPILGSWAKNDDEFESKSEEIGNEAFLHDTESQKLANMRKKSDGDDLQGNSHQTPTVWKGNSILKQSRIREEYNPNENDASIGHLVPGIRHQRQASDRDVTASTKADGKVHVRTTISQPILVVIILLCILIVLIALSICFLLLQNDDQSVYLARQQQDEIQFYSQESWEPEEKETEKREFLPLSQPATWKKMSKEAIDEPSLPTEEHTPGSLRKDASASSLEEQLSVVLGTGSTRTNV